MKNLYKKSLAILCSSLILSTIACTNKISANNALLLTPKTQNSTIKTFSTNQAQQITTNNKDAIIALAQALFAQNFKDDLKPNGSVVTPEQAQAMLNSIIGNVTSGQTKINLKDIYSLLTKDVQAQTVAYGYSDGPVGAKFNAKSEPDNLPRISNEEITKLKSLLQPGDVILCGNNKSFVHAIFYIGDNTIIHSLATKVNGKLLGVVKQTLDEYLASSERDMFVVLRDKNLNPQDLQKATEYASQQVGKAYDTLFLVDSDTRFYCTELVYQALKRMSNPPRVFTHDVSVGWTLVSVEDFMDSPDLETVWTKNYTRPEVGKLHSY